MAEMRTNNNRQDWDRMELPASSWGIPFLTIAIALLAAVVALA